MQNQEFFRIVSFDRLKEIVGKKALTFVTFDKWQDKFEGYVIQAMKSPGGIVALKRVIDRTGSPMDFVMLYDVLHKEQKSVHMQSWTGCPEKEKMWKSYSPDGRSVRIKTCFNKFRCLGPLFFKEIEYRPVLTLEDEVQNLFSDYDGNKSFDLLNVFTRKRKSFEYEEIRVCTPPRWTFMSDQNDSPTRENGSLLDLSFAHVPDFIESVLVDPYASDKHVELIRSFCEANNLTFEGKSKLHDFVLR